MLESHCCSATVVNNPANKKHAEIKQALFRTFAVTLYNNSNSYMNKNARGYLIFNDYQEALSAAYFWCA